MPQTLFKPEERTNSLNQEIVVQITKKQLLIFFQALVVIGSIALNIVALQINTPFLRELFISQAIILLIFFIKTSKSNTISKN
ncbi:hypothetical protein [Polaribacter sp.]|uniref:hypothetical protein n=1 Tax=Polaribacter sp. TaxID=1920175 RepID=UPI003F6BAC45